MRDRETTLRKFKTLTRNPKPQTHLACRIFSTTAVRSAGGRKETLADSDKRFLEADGGLLGAEGLGFRVQGSGLIALLRFRA